MGRELRPLVAGGYYHVGTRGNNKAPIVLDDTDRQTFIHILNRVASRYGWKLHARCLMGNHYHLVVETPLTNLSDGMRDLNGQYARAFNYRHRRCDHVFGRRFWSKLIESDDQYEATIEYVVHNPIHHGFAARLGQWRWTSAPGISAVDSSDVARHGQADPATLARSLPDGRAPAAHRARRQVKRRGLLRDVGRSVRPPVLFGPGRTARSRGPPPVAAR